MRRMFPTSFVRPPYTQNGVRLAAPIATRDRRVGHDPVTRRQGRCGLAAEPPGHRQRYGGERDLHGIARDEWEHAERKRALGAHETGEPRDAEDEDDQVREGHRDDRREHAPIEASLGERADDRRGRDEADEVARRRTERDWHARDRARRPRRRAAGEHGQAREPSATYAASVAAPRRAPSA